MCSIKCGFRGKCVSHELEAGRLGVCVRACRNPPAVCAGYFGTMPFDIVDIAVKFQRKAELQLKCTARKTTCCTVAHRVAKIPSTCCWLAGWLLAASGTRFTHPPPMRCGAANRLLCTCRRHVWFFLLCVCVCVVLCCCFYCTRLEVTNRR